MELLTAIEHLPPVEALKRSFVVYPLVNAAHILSVGALVTSVMLMDLRLLGFFPTVDSNPLISLLRRLAFGAFGLALLTGLALFSVRAADYAFNPAFQIKIALLMLAGVNLAVFRLSAGQNAKPTGIGRLAAAVSIALWPAILVAGRFVGFL